MNEFNPKPGDPIYGAPDAMLSLVPREPGARPVAVVEAFDPETGTITMRGVLQPVPRTIPQCVDDLVADGFETFVPPVPAWKLPSVETFDPDAYWPRAYEQLEAHHREETAALLEIIRELTRRLRGDEP